MRKVDILCLSSWHSVGGAQLCAQDLVQFLIKNGYSSELGFLFERDASARFEKTPTYVVAQSAPQNVFQWIGFLSRFLMYIAAKRPRVVYGFHPLANIIGALFSIVGNYKFVATQHNPANVQNKKIKVMEKIVGSTFLYRKNIAVSHSVKESFLGYPRSYLSKMRVIYNTPPVIAEARWSKAESRKSLGLPDNKIILGFIGRFHEQKNIIFAVNLMPSVSKMHLALAGDGPLFQDLLDEAKKNGNNFSFLGRLDGERVSEFYKSIDILIFPSLYEGHSRVLLEAMSLGVPIIANDIPVLREAGGDAILYCELVPEKWVELLEGLNSDDLQQMSIKSRQRAKYFSDESSLLEYMNVAGLPKEVGR